MRSRTAPGVWPANSSASPYSVSPTRSRSASGKSLCRRFARKNTIAATLVTPINYCGWPTTAQPTADAHFRDDGARYIVPESAAVPIQYRGLPLDAIEDAIGRSSAMQNALNLLVRKQERIEGRPVTPLHGGHVGLLCTAGMLNGVFGKADGRHIAHWRSVKHVDVYHEEEDGYQIVRRRERFSHELTLAYKSGRVLVLKETEEKATSDEKCA